MTGHNYTGLGLVVMVKLLHSIAADPPSGGFKWLNIELRGVDVMATT